MRRHAHQPAEADGPGCSEVNAPLSRATEWESVTKTGSGRATTGARAERRRSELKAKGFPPEMLWREI